jgi:hypothetical protein
MPPPQLITVLDLLSWSRSSVTEFALRELVNSGLLAPNVEGAPPAWIALPVTDRESNSLFGCVVSFVRHHEHGFTAPASRFMRGLCYHYGVELHNFAPNAILQADTFVGVCEGFLGIPVNWDLWVHLFRAELHTVATTEMRVRRAVRAGGQTFSVRDLRKEWYIPCTMTSSNAEREKGWFYLRNEGASLPPYTDKVLKAKTDTWHHDLSPSSRQDRLESLLNGLRSGGRRASRGFGSCQPTSPADRSPNGEEAPHLRDDRGRRPYNTGTLAAAARAFSSGVRNDEGEARSQP